MKKLPDSDWLAAIQLSVTPVQITNRNLDYGWLKDNMNFSKPTISRKMMTERLCWKIEKSFLEWEKSGFEKECNLSFLKNPQVQINSRLSEKNRMITDTNFTFGGHSFHLTKR